jgi:hypothetical protein
MQVLCKSSQTSSDIKCPTCGEGFQIYWERTSRVERIQTLTKIQQALVGHHETLIGTDQGADSGPHPTNAFNIPSWGGHPHFSGAALLGGFPGLAR